jgi:anaphase-promoting complex subunit 4
VWERHQELLGPAESANRRILCLAWAFNFIDVPNVKARVGDGPRPAAPASSDGLGTTDNWDTAWDGVTLNDILQGMHDLKVLDASPDLPGQITMTDPERLLPKISPIPPAPTGPLGRPVQSTPDAFTSQSSIDAMFHSQHLEFNNAVETLLLCHVNGEISPTMYNSLELAPTRLPVGWTLKPDARVIHATHSYSRSHCLLADISCAPQQSLTSRAQETRSEPVDRGQYRLSLVPLTFRFMANSGFQVHLVGAKQQQLANLLRYLQECIRSISAYWFHSQDLPLRFMRNINETLESKGEGDLVTNLYHLAVTGHCPAPIKEWLVDELTESVSVADVCSRTIQRNTG